MKKFIVGCYLVLTVAACQAELESRDKGVKSFLLPNSCLEILHTMMHERDIKDYNVTELDIPHRMFEQKHSLVEIAVGQVDVPEGQPKVDIYEEAATTNFGYEVLVKCNPDAKYIIKRNGNEWVRLGEIVEELQRKNIGMEGIKIEDDEVWLFYSKTDEEKYEESRCKTSECMYKRMQERLKKREGQ